MEFKEKLLKESFKLFMKYGIRSISMDDISRELGVSKKTIYSVVENKNELVTEVVSRYVKTERQEVGEIIKKASNAIDGMLNCAAHILAFLRAVKPTLLFDLHKYHPDAWRIIETDHFKYLEEIITENISRGQKEDLYRLDLDPKVIAKLYVAKAKLMKDEDVFPINEYPRPELFQTFISYHMRGIITQKGYKYLTRINAIDHDEK